MPGKGWKTTLRIVGLALITAAVSCGSKNQESTVADDDILVAVGDSTLRVNEVIARIPRGLQPSDSIRIFNNIVDTWVRNLILAEVAEKNIPDPDRIERMVEAYRNSLIVNEYLSSMAEKDSKEIPESRIKEYYDQHRDELILTQPVIKGIYIKVPEDDPQLENLRQWVSDFTDQSVDMIEKTGLRHATGYEYFRDDWQEWNVIADQIPHRFYDSDAFLRSSSEFEITADGSVYLLHISEYQLSGTGMPYEYARHKIREILRAEDAESMRRTLIHDIYSRKIEEGELRPGLYDPVKREMKIINKKIK